MVRIPTGTWAMRVRIPTRRVYLKGYSLTTELLPPKQLGEGSNPSAGTNPYNKPLRGGFRNIVIWLIVITNRS